MLRSTFRKSLRLFGFDVVRYQPDSFPVDFAPEEIETVRAVRPWTMTSPERIFALQHATRYISEFQIKGDVVECGVWKGGSMAVVARTLLQLADTSRHLYLFDTFEGMPRPTADDVEYSGKLAEKVLEDSAGVRCDDAPLEVVREVLYATGYPRGKIHFIQGRVEDTIPSAAPNQIALLRLDTDWYESTRHELVHLYPRLTAAGVLIIDDYGHWRGSRKATDEYFTQNQEPILLNRIDYTGRIAVKPQQRSATSN